MCQRHMASCVERDVYKRQILLQCPKKALNFPFCSGNAPIPTILPPQAVQVFVLIVSLRFRNIKRPLSARADRGRTNAVPPLVHRLLTKPALRSANTPLRDNGRNRHTPTMRRAHFRGQLRDVFACRRLLSRTDRKLSGDGMWLGTSSLRHCDLIAFTSAV